MLVPPISLRGSLQIWILDSCCFPCQQRATADSGFWILAPNLKMCASALITLNSEFSLLLVRASKRFRILDSDLCLPIAAFDFAQGPQGAANLQASQDPSWDSDSGRSWSRAAARRRWVCRVIREHDFQGDLILDSGILTSVTHLGNLLVHYTSIINQLRAGYTSVTLCLAESESRIMSLAISKVKIQNSELWAWPSLDLGVGQGDRFDPSLVIPDSGFWILWAWKQ